MSNRIAVVGEAEGDCRLAAALIDQVILRHVVDYIDETNLGDHRRTSAATIPKSS